MSSADVCFIRAPVAQPAKTRVGGHGLYGEGSFETLIMQLPHRTPPYQQPRSPASLNYGHPLASNLLFATIGDGYDLVSRRWGERFQTVNIVNTYHPLLGTCVQFLSGQGGQIHWTDIPPTKGNAPLSIEWISMFPADPPDSMRMFCHGPCLVEYADGATYLGQGRGILNTASYSTYFWGWGAADAGLSNNFNVSGVVEHWVATRAGAYTAPVKFYRNGILNGTTASSTLVDQVGNSTYIDIGFRGAGYNLALWGTMYISKISYYAKELSAPEVYSLARNPWQIYARNRTRVFMAMRGRIVPQIRSTIPLKVGGAAIRNRMKPFAGNGQVRVAGGAVIGFTKYFDTPAALRITGAGPTELYDATKGFLGLVLAGTGKQYIQPNNYSGVNWSNPLSRDLESLINFGGSPQCAVTGQLPTAWYNNTNISIARYPARGLGFNSTSGGLQYNGLTASRMNIEGGKPKTVAVYCARPQFSGADRHFIYLNATAGTGTIFVIWWYNGGGVVRFEGYNVMADISSGSSLWPAEGMPVCVAMTYGEGTNTWRAYVNGTQGASTSSAASNLTSTAYLLFQGTILYPRYVSAIWSRALSSAELKSFSQNPYQLFAPTRRLIGFGRAPLFHADIYVATGGVTVSGTASTQAWLQTGLIVGGVGDYYQKRGDIYVGVGGVIASGAAEIETQIADNWYGAGGCRVSGAADTSHTYQYVAAGWVLASGVAEHSHNYLYDGYGIAKAGGVAVSRIATGWNPVGQGGPVISGVARTAHTLVQYRASGGGVGGGTADYWKSKIPNIIGGLRLDGVASTIEVDIVTFVGGVKAAGHGDMLFSRCPDVSGGLILYGQADDVVIKAPGAPPPLMNVRVAGTGSPYFWLSQIGTATGIRLFLPQRRYEQPTGPASVADEWKDKGVRSCAAFTPYGVQAAQLVRNGNGYFRAGLGGTGWFAGGTGTSYLTSPVALFNLVQGTLLEVFVPYSVAIDQVVGAYEATDTTYQYDGFGDTTGAQTEIHFGLVANRLRFVTRIGNTANTYLASPTNYVPNAKYCVVGTYKSGGLKVIWEGGKPVAQGASGTYTSVAAPAVNRYGSTGYTAVNLGSRCGLLLSATFDTVLSDSDCIRLSTNPWQLFQPYQRRVFVPVRRHTSIRTASVSGGLRANPHGYFTNGIIYGYDVAGGTRLGGQADSSLQTLHTYSTSGGVELYGVAATEQILVWEWSGQQGGVVGGAATTRYSTVYHWWGMGGLLPGGTALLEQRIAWTYEPVGPVIVSGAAEIVSTLLRTYIYDSSGGAVLTGQAEVQAPKEWTTKGGALLGGQADCSAYNYFVYDSLGELLVSGAALIDKRYTMYYTPILSGGVAVTGTAEVRNIDVTAVVGGAWITGAAEIVKRFVFATTASLVASGYGYGNFRRTFDYTLRGGYKVGGRAILRQRTNRAYLPSGGLRVAGAATTKLQQPVIRTYTAAGAAVLGGNARVRYVPPIIGFGGAEVAGRAVYAHSRMYQWVGGFRISGVARYNKSRRRDYLTSGGLQGAGAALSAYEAGYIYKPQIGGVRVGTRTTVQLVSRSIELVRVAVQIGKVTRRTTSVRTAFLSPLQMTQVKPITSSMTTQLSQTSAVTLRVARTLNVMPLPEDYELVRFGLQTTQVFDIPLSVDRDLTRTLTTQRVYRTTLNARCRYATTLATTTTVKANLLMQEIASYS